MTLNTTTSNIEMRLFLSFRSVGSSPLDASLLSCIYLMSHVRQRGLFIVLRRFVFAPDLDTHFLRSPVVPVIPARRSSFPSRVLASAYVLVAY